MLTDPWFSEKSLYHPGEPIALQPGELPPLDAVIISHHHYDHCDLAAFAAYRDNGVPTMVARPVAPRAGRGLHRRPGPGAMAGRRRRRPYGHRRAGQARGLRDHLRDQRRRRSVYFAGDTLPDRVDVALLPVNGLQIRPQLNKQVVMNAEQAAGLIAVLRPEMTIPHHYAFTGGRLGDRLITKGDRDSRPSQSSRSCSPANP